MVTPERPRSAAAVATLMASLLSPSLLAPLVLAPAWPTAAAHASATSALSVASSADVAEAADVAEVGSCQGGVNEPVHPLSLFPDVLCALLQ